MTTINQALVRAILEHPDDHPWTMQGIGLLALRLDDHREHRLHVWDPDSCIEEAPVHDHPFDFTSTVIAGALTNVRYEQDASGIEYHRNRYVLGAEDARQVDTVRLSGTPTTYTAGDEYSQRAPELHSSHQIPGTVTLIRQTFRDFSELTVCYRDAGTWVTGQSRPATRDQVRRITGLALERLASEVLTPAR